MARLSAPPHKRPPTVRRSKRPAARWPEAAEHLLRPADTEHQRGAARAACAAAARSCAAVSCGRPRELASAGLSSKSLCSIPEIETHR